MTGKAKTRLIDGGEAIAFNSQLDYKSMALLREKISAVLMALQQEEDRRTRRRQRLVKGSYIKTVHYLVQTDALCLYFSGFETLAIKPLQCEHTTQLGLQLTIIFLITLSDDYFHD